MRPHRHLRRRRQRRRLLSKRLAQTDYRGHRCARPHEPVVELDCTRAPPDARAFFDASRAAAAALRAARLRAHGGARRRLGRVRRRGPGAGVVRRAGPGRRTEGGPGRWCASAAVRAGQRVPAAGPRLRGRGAPPPRDGRGVPVLPDDAAPGRGRRGPAARAASPCGASCGRTCFPRRAHSCPRSSSRTRTSRWPRLRPEHVVGLHHDFHDNVLTRPAARSASACGTRNHECPAAGGRPGPRPRTAASSTETSASRPTAATPRPRRRWTSTARSTTRATATTATRCWTRRWRSRPIMKRNRRRCSPGLPELRDAQGAARPAVVRRLPSAPATRSTSRAASGTRSSSAAGSTRRRTAGAVPARRRFLRPALHEQLLGRRLGAAAARRPRSKTSHWPGVRRGERPLLAPVRPEPRRARRSRKPPAASAASTSPVSAAAAFVEADGFSASARASRPPRGRATAGVERAAHLRRVRVRVAEDGVEAGRPPHAARLASPRPRGAS